MASIYWDENLPSGTSAVRLGDDDIRSFKTNVRGGLAEEHVWATGPSTADRGLHTPNASRISYVTAANQPATVSDKTGMLIMRGANPFAVWAHINVLGSEASYRIAGRRAVQGRGNPDAASYLELDYQKVKSGSAFSYTNAFASAPFVVCTVESTSDDFSRISTIGNHSALAQAYDSAGLADSEASIYVLAIGSVNE